MPERTDTRILSFSRDWAGLTQQGRINISIGQIVAGHPLRQILAHETAHDVLLKTSQLGWVQMALSSEGLDPAPRGEIRRRCAELLDHSVTASRYTHEAVATFLPSLGMAPQDLVSYRARHRQDYLDAADALEWLRSRPFDDDLKREVAFSLGKLALALPILDEWQQHGLSDPDAAAHWFRTPAHRPDRRFPALCRFASTRSDEALARIGSEGVAEAAEMCRDVTVDGRRLSFAGLADSALDLSGMEELTGTVFGPMLSDPSIPERERSRLRERWRQPWLSLPGLTPTLMSVLLTPTTSASGRIDVDPPIEALGGYPLVRVLYNALDQDVPGIEPVDAAPMLLQPGESALWFVSADGGGRACHLRPGAMREWIESLEDDTTVCVRDGAYFFGLPIGEPRLLERRHVVLVQHRVPQQLLLELPVLGLDPGSNDVLVTTLGSDHADVAYVLMRPRSGWPVLMMPTAMITASRLVDGLLSAEGRVGFTSIAPGEFLDSPAVVRDVLRVLSDFEDRPWPPELSLSPSGSTPGEPAPRGPAAGGHLDTLLGQAASAWERYTAEATPDSVQVFLAAAEAVLDSPELAALPVPRRIDILESFGESCGVAHQRGGSTLPLERAVGAFRRLIAELPDDWPDPARLRYLTTAGGLLLELWAETGDPAVRTEAVGLLREARTPGFD